MMNFIVIINQILWMPILNYTQTLLPAGPVRVWPGGAAAVRTLLPGVAGENCPLCGLAGGLGGLRHGGPNLPLLRQAGVALPP